MEPQGTLVGEVRMTGWSQQRRTERKRVVEWETGAPLRQKSKEPPSLFNAANIPKKTRVRTFPGSKQRSTDDNFDRAVVPRRLDKVQKSIILEMKMVKTDNCVIGFKCWPATT